VQRSQQVTSTAHSVITPGRVGVAHCKTTHNHRKIHTMIPSSAAQIETIIELATARLCLAHAAGDAAVVACQRGILDRAQRILQIVGAQ
jgi:hypothetical protein